MTWFSESVFLFSYEQCAAAECYGTAHGRQMFEWPWISRENEKIFSSVFAPYFEHYRSKKGCRIFENIQFENVHLRKTKMKGHLHILTKTKIGDFLLMALKCIEEWSYCKEDFLWGEWGQNLEVTSRRSGGFGEMEHQLAYSCREVTEIIEPGSVQWWMAGGQEREGNKLKKVQTWYEENLFPYKNSQAGAGRLLREVTHSPSLEVFKTNVVNSMNSLRSHSCISCEQVSWLESSRSPSNANDWYLSSFCIETGTPQKNNDVGCWTVVVLWCEEFVVLGWRCLWDFSWTGEESLSQSIVSCYPGWFGMLFIFNIKFQTTLGI